MLQQLTPQERERYYSDPDFRKQVLRSQSFFYRWRRMVMIAGAVVIAVLVWFGVRVAAGLPSLEGIENPKAEFATRIYSVEGEVIDQFFIKNRTFVRLDSMPKSLIDALLAVEDRDFYNHWGIDLWGNVRATIVNVFSLSVRQGASTITQQLARNLYLSNERRVVRKVREVITAIQIERTYTKSEILELYLNTVYWGRGAYGIHAAALTYFGKPEHNLTLNECAFLAAILKGPENYEPKKYYERALKRRNAVLKAMAECGYISDATKERAYQEAITVRNMGMLSSLAPHFAEMIRQQLTREPALKNYDLYRDGLSIYTTISAPMQRAANRAVDEHIAEFQKQFNKYWNWKKHADILESMVKEAVTSHPLYLAAKNDQEKKNVEKTLRNQAAFIDSVKREATRIQVGFVCIDPETGAVRAMVGASNYQDVRYGLNHAAQIRRQAGSAFKPFTYAAVIDQGLTPETRISNAPLHYTLPSGDVWSPSNFGGERLSDSLALRTALKYSVNIIAARLITEVTSPAEVVKYAHRMGIKSYLPIVPSLALGTADVSPLELTSAYGVFVAQGILHEPFAMYRVEDRTGKVLLRGTNEVRDALNPQTAATMVTMMQGVVNGGTGTHGVRTFFQGAAAGKTGTTQNYTDAWFIGYTPQLVAGAWVGFDDPRIKFGGDYGQGGHAAAPIWGRFMKYVYEDRSLRMPQIPFPQAPPVVSIESDSAEVKNPEEIRE